MSVQFAEVYWHGIDCRRLISLSKGAIGVRKCRLTDKKEVWPSSKTLEGKTIGGALLEAVAGNQPGIELVMTGLNDGSKPPTTEDASEILCL